MTRGPTPVTPRFADQLEELLRAQVGQRPRRPLRSLRVRRVVVPAICLALVGGLALLPGLVDRSFDLVTAWGAAGQPAPPPGVEASAEDIWDPDTWDELRPRLEDAGVTFDVVERPVNPAAAGTVSMVEARRGPHGISEPQPLDDGGYRFYRGNILEVVVGVADEHAGYTGLSLFEVWPDLCPAIVWDDPAATAANLEDAGFTVTRWSLVEWNGQSGRGPTTSTDLAGPRRDTRIVSVLAAPASSREVPDPNRKELTIELERTAWPPSHGAGC